MSMSDLPLIVVDNSLVDERGHHLGLALTIAQTAIKAGRKLIVYCHRDFDPARLPPEVVVRPVFTMSVYEMLAARPREIDLSRELLATLRRIETEVPSGGAVFFHTADTFTFLAVAEWLAGRATQPSATFHCHVATPYEPRLMPGFAARSQLFHRALMDLARYDDPFRQVFFWTETERLAEYYRRAYALKASVLALPAPPWSATSAAGSSPRPGRLVALFPGAAREEKGFLRLPGLAEAIAARPDLHAAITLRLQYSAPIAGLSPGAQKAYEQLRAYSFVEFIDGALDTETYVSEMHGCDMVLMLYNPSNYFARGSAIAIEAMSCGKYILGMRGTFMEDLRHEGLARFGADIAGWLAHITELATDLDRKRAQGRQAGQRFASRHTPEAYLARLDRRARFSVHFDSLRVQGLGMTAPLLALGEEDALYRRVP